MTDKPWYPFFVGDYSQKTKHLSMLEHGAYRLLIDHYFATKSPLPNDSTKLFRICGARSPSERKAVLSVAAEFFTEIGTLLHHERCDSEIAKMLKKSKTNSANAKGTHERSPSEGTSETASTCARVTVTVTDRSNNSDITATTAATPFERIFDYGTSLLPDLAAKDTSHIRMWLTDGCDVDLDILPTIKRVAVNKPSSWSYFTPAIAQAKATRLRVMPEGTPTPGAYGKPNYTDDDYINHMRMKGKLDDETGRH